jgi:hypothetical protein
MDQNLFEIVLNKAQDFLKQRNIEIVSEETLMKALPLVIECVETVKNNGVTGEEKKGLAVRVIIFLIDASNLDKEKEVVIRNLIDSGTLETTIDIIVDASKGKFELNRKNKRRLLSWVIGVLTNVCGAQEAAVTEEETAVTEEEAVVPEEEAVVPEEETAVTEEGKVRVSRML